MSSDELCFKEEEVWMGLMAWMGNKQAEEVEVTKIMETVRFGLLDPEFFQSRVMPHPHFQSLDNWSSMGSLVVGTDIYLCGGQMIKEGLSPVKVLMRFSANTMEVTRLSMMRDCRNYVGLAVHSGSIYAIGGVSDGVPMFLSSVEKFDISFNQWFRVSSMHKARSAAGVATLRDKIYVVGGKDGVGVTSTAEVFNPATGRWTMIKSMR